MTLSDPRRITDELLSAYIDDEVTDQERAIVEAAIASDEEIAWRLTSLRQTVTLLRDLPELDLPRSFVLTFDQVRSVQSDEQLVTAGAMERGPVAVPAQPKSAPTLQPEGGFWADVAEGWRRFWQGGNPVLRNAAAVSFALMLLVAGSGQLINNAVTQPAGMMATAPEAAPMAAPASESAANMAASSAASESNTATSGEAVALAPTAEATVAKASDTESLQVQATSASDAPAAANARIMQSQAEPAASASASDTTENDEAAGETTPNDAAPNDNAGESTESMVAESAATAEEAAPEEPMAAAAAAVPAEDAAAEEAVGEQPAAEEAPTEEQAGVAAMAAPMPLPAEAEPPLVANPGPGMGAGGGARPESGGGGPEGDLPPGAGSDGALVPQQAYGFNVDTTTAPTTLPLEESEEAISDTVEAYNVPVTESEGDSAEAVADVAVTPAVEVSEAAAASQTEPTVTPEAVALVAPGAITSSEVVENVQSEEGAVPTSEGGNLPVVWIAQATMLLLTFIFASLWWRSRKAR